ncbi:DUF6192 family protein [Streptomyces sp. NPDC001404]|uniref:DUF6192 family protein n=1 Tax=Streptomyces sp. NPDC001404 TaxID=3364571 RepID=UPI0036A9B7AF
MVTEAQNLIERKGDHQFAIGDLALKLAPLHAHGGTGRHLRPERAAQRGGVAWALNRFSSDIPLPLATIKCYRWVASRWPEPRRADGVSHGVHRILADIRDETERWERILHPPMHTKSGRRCWTLDGAKRVLGRPVECPTTVQEKLRIIGELTCDRAVAALVVSSLLKQHPVAFLTVLDPTTRHLLNEAQATLCRNGRPGSRIGPAAAPDGMPAHHSMQFVELIVACQRYVAALGQVAAELGSQQLTEDEHTAVRTHVAHVRESTDWAETVVRSGAVGMNEG